MTLEEFKKVVSASSPAPKDLPDLLQALLQDARGSWDDAHRIAQEIETAEGSWVHAYLHRKEGDRTNALYWYRRAGKPQSSVPLAREWEEIADHLLKLELPH